jgi:hypothetical protein
MLYEVTKGYYDVVIEEKERRRRKEKPITSNHNRILTALKKINTVRLNFAKIKRAPRNVASRLSFHHKLILSRRLAPQT